MVLASFRSHLHRCRVFLLWRFRERNRAVHASSTFPGFSCLCEYDELILKPSTRNLILVMWSYVVFCDAFSSNNHLYLTRRIGWVPRLDFMPHITSRDITVRGER
jgi:hypothetical protein